MKSFLHEPHPDYNRLLAANLKNYMRVRKISAKALAIDIQKVNPKFDQSTISQILSGKGNPTLKKLGHIADALDVNIGDLLMPEEILKYIVAGDKQGLLEWTKTRMRLAKIGPPKKPK